MQADKRIKNQAGSVSDKILPSVEHYKIVEFIMANINIFIKDYIDGENEKGLNQNFVICMNNHIDNDKLKFIFHHEYIENTLSGQSPQIDIGVIPKGSTKAIFSLEAKRLNSKLPLSRKKEYVIGDGGGIERFKREKHAKNLSHAGIIGYVQTDDFNTWENKINAWIDYEIKHVSSDLTWDENDKLTKDSESNKISKYYSKHLCSSKKYIHLTHLWIKLN